MQVQAAIPRDTPPNLAEAIDITGRRSVEGRLDSPGDSLVYRLQIDEPGIVSFEISGEADAEITLYDSNGNVLARGVPGTLPDGQAIPRTAPVPEVRAVPLVAVFAVVAVRTAIPIFARVALRKATGAAVRTGAFALRHAKTAFAVTRVLTKKLEFDVKYSSLLDIAQSFEVHDHFDGETSVEHEWNITPSVQIPRWGLAVELKVDSTGTVRMSRGSGSVMCGSGTKYDQTIETTLTLTWRQTTIVELPSKVQFNLLRDTAPRRKGSEAISVTVPEGGSGTVLLTDYIEDPKGRSLTFTPGDPVPDGLSVTRNGARWTIAAKEGVTGGTIIVTAATGTGRARECWNFPLRVRMVPNEDSMVPNEDSLDDVTVSIPSSCPREVQICVRDYACEDGDIVRVSLNGTRLFERELFNTSYCVSAPVLVGTNSIELFAVNGTGYKGPCSYADANTGEISINGGTQRWEHSGGRGSRANLTVNIGPSGGRCFSTMGPSPQPNRPPSIRRSIASIALTVGESETIDLSSYFTDPDGDTLSYTPTLSSGGESAVNATVSGDDLRIRALAAPGARIRVTARDPGGLTVHQDFDVRVQRSRVYGSIAFGRGVRGTYSVATGSGNSAAAARSAAVNNCNSRSGGITCSEMAAFSNSCAAVARSNDNNFSFVWGYGSRSEAERAAVNHCRQNGWTGCVLLSSDTTGDGRFSVCYGT